MPARRRGTLHYERRNLYPCPFVDIASGIFKARRYEAANFGGTGRFACVYRTTKALLVVVLSGVGDTNPELLRAPVNMILSHND